MNTLSAAAECVSLPGKAASSFLTIPRMRTKRSCWSDSCGPSHEESILPLLRPARPNNRFVQESDKRQHCLKRLNERFVETRGGRVFGRAIPACEKLFVPQVICDD